MHYTINKEHPYYVYAHYKADTNEIFYVGMGKNDRAYFFRNRGKEWSDIVLKHGIIIKIISIFENEVDTATFENHLILLYGRLDLKTGPLINLTNGKGLNGYKNSDITKRRKSTAAKKRVEREGGIFNRGSRNPNFDPTIYVWEYIDGTIEKCTRSDFYTKHNFCRTMVRHLIIGKKDSYNDWKLVK